MRILKLTLLSLALASGTAHAAAPLKLKVKARWDAAIGAIPGQARKHPTGSVMTSFSSVGAKGGGTNATTDSYVVGKGGKLRLGWKTISHYDDKGETRFVMTRNHMKNDQPQRAPVRTRVRYFEADGRPKTTTALDHATGKIDHQVH